MRSLNMAVRQGNFVKISHNQVSEQDGLHAGRQESNIVHIGQKNLESTLQNQVSFLTSRNLDLM